MMKNKMLALSLGAALISGQAYAHGDHGHDHHHDHAHGAPMTEMEIKASKGVFNDSDVKNRKLTDWEGKWQSVYPIFLTGAMDPVFRKKAEEDKSKSFEEYKEYYKKGYATDVLSIGIENGVMTFTSGDKVSSCPYVYAGREILHYTSGKKGVRYLFECTKTNTGAPKFVQFSDHTIAPRKSAHFHIFMGNSSQEALLKEMDNWPTYFPANLTNSQVVDDLLHH